MFREIFSKIWNFAGVSIAAQTFTIPFVLVYFHQFPLYFILGNLLLVPLGLLVFYLGALYLLVLSVGISFPQLGQLLDLVIRLMVGMGDSIAKFPHAMINFDSFTPLDMLAYYVFIVIIFFIKPLSIKSHDQIFHHNQGRHPYYQFELFLFLRLVYLAILR